MTFRPDMIITDETRPAAISALVSAGHPLTALEALGNVALSNLYHDRTPQPSALQRLAAAAFVAGVNARPYGAAPPVPRPPTVTHYRTDLVIQIARLGHAILLVGPAGCGKTTIGEHTANALQLPFYITSTINDTHELMGFVDGHGKYHDTPFRQAFEHGGLWIADEIDAWDASALLAANSALANGYANFPDRSERVVRHTDFRMVATANTFGTGADRVYVGRNELDAASLDRFATVDVDYDLTLERLFAGDAHKWLDYVWQVRKSVNEKRVRHVVSSRAISMGAAALRSGIDWDIVAECYLFKGMSEKDRNKVNV
jgi:cobaltochelatase CobS